MTSDQVMPAAAARLHDVVSVFSPVAKALHPVLEKVRPYGMQFDDLFERTFGPCHPLSKKMPLMTPHHALLFAVCYLTFVLTAMPLLRSLKLSLKLKPVMRVYNVFMVGLSFYMGTKAVLLAREANSTLFCVPLAASSKGGDEMAQLVWIFTYSKTVEFLDTVFMIVEGRWRQVSFLHVYHHVSILSYWFTILWVCPGSDAYFSLAGNSFIHVLMYGYYLLASFGYSPWWKLYITRAQILQFCCFCVQSVYVGYVQTGAVCDFPDVLSRGLLWYMLTLIALFTHFLVSSKRRASATRPRGGTRVKAQKSQ